MGGFEELIQRPPLVLNEEKPRVVKPRPQHPFVALAYVFIHPAPANRDELGHQPPRVIAHREESLVLGHRGDQYRLRQLQILVGEAALQRLRPLRQEGVLLHQVAAQIRGSRAHRLRAVGNHLHPNLRVRLHHPRAEFTHQIVQGSRLERLGMLKSVPPARQPRCNPRPRARHEFTVKRGQNPPHRPRKPHRQVRPTHRLRERHLLQSRRNQLAQNLARRAARLGLRHPHVLAVALCRGRIHPLPSAESFQRLRRLPFGVIGGPHRRTPAPLLAVWLLRKQSFERHNQSSRRAVQLHPIYAQPTLFQHALDFGG